MNHERATAIVNAVVAATRAPVSVVVADSHGEIVASLRMDGAALDTFENARRKAYTAARSDTPTRAVGVSGLPGIEDDALARAALGDAGYDAP